MAGEGLKKSKPQGYRADISAVSDSQAARKVLHRKEEDNGPSFAMIKRVRQILSDETVEELERLVSELLAIRHWDMKYRRNRFPECYETVAFAARQERRSEIIRHLLRLSR